MSHFIDAVEVSSYRCGHGCYVSLDQKHFDCQFCRNNPRDRTVTDVEIIGKKKDLLFQLADCRPSVEKQKWIEKTYPFDGYTPAFNCFQIGKAKLKTFFIFRGNGVHHPEFGNGVVISERDDSVLVRFPDSVRTVKRSELSRVEYPTDDARSKELDKQIKYHSTRRDAMPVEDQENTNEAEKELFLKFEPLILLEIKSPRYRTFIQAIGDDLYGYASQGLLNAVRRKGADLEGAYARIAIRNAIRSGLKNEIHPAVGGNELAFEFALDPGSDQPYSKVERELSILKILKQNLPVLEAKILYLRYLGIGRSTRNVGQILGISKTSVSRLELYALDRLIEVALKAGKDSQTWI